MTKFNKIFINKDIDLVNHLNQVAANLDQVLNTGSAALLNNSVHLTQVAFGFGHNKDLPFSQEVGFRTFYVRSSPGSSTYTAYDGYMVKHGLDRAPVGFIHTNPDPLSFDSVPGNNILTWIKPESGNTQVKYALKILTSPGVYKDYFIDPKKFIVLNWRGVTDRTRFNLLFF